MFGLNFEQIKSLLVKALAILGGFLAGWSATKGGWIVQNWELISSIVLSIGTLVWSVKANTATSIVKAAESIPEVKAVQVTSASGIADAGVTGPKVTT